MENCFKFVKRKLLPKSISFTPLMKLYPSLSSSLRRVLSRIFSVFKSECTILWLLMRNSAFATYTTMIFNYVWSSLILWMSYLYSICIIRYLRDRTFLRRRFLLSTRTNCYPRIHHKLRSIATNRLYEFHESKVCRCCLSRYGSQTLLLPILLFRRSTNQTKSL